MLNGDAVYTAAENQGNVYSEMSQVQVMFCLLDVH